MRRSGPAEVSAAALSTVVRVVPRRRITLVAGLGLREVGSMTTDPRDVLTLEAARSRGITRHAIAHRVARGQWQRVFPRVYATYSGPISEETRLAAALAYAGEGAVLSHQSAAARH